ncbi:hypothetical protein K435DRAFT_961268 [Dendrothele bispora CBS 962.96]|uniref:WD40 repeat-like protein n=1 Tax=Dendrothele bispora (strain CBS 962.96) TaxID=1314807 RepID=A0A4S8MQF2_DENBC|nr:hypothetical protein K435DRAFT_961268 [Dendrothele bispora CBS 962.96]
MNKHFPGFYWDPKKNRYFPGTPPQSEQQSPAAQAHSKQRLYRFHHPLHSPCSLQYTTSYVERDQILHRMRSCSISTTSRMIHTQPSTIGKITALCSSPDGFPRNFVGDDTGCLYYRTASNDYHPCPLYPHSQVSSINISRQKCVATCFGPVAGIAIIDIANITDDDDDDVQNGLNLSATRASGSTDNIHNNNDNGVVVDHMHSLQEPTLLRLNDIHDLWTGFLRENALTLGANRQAIYIPDVSSLHLQVLHTGSDVFSISQHSDSESGGFGSRNPNLIYTGCRNGSVMRFDLRTRTGPTRNSSRGEGKVHKKKLFQLRDPYDPATFTSANVNYANVGSRGYDRGRGRGRGRGFGRGPTGDFSSNLSSSTSDVSSSVVYLKTIKEQQLLVARMNGELNVYDLRFPDQSTPIRTFKGHINSVTQWLGICVDPYENYLFAAGEDAKIRGWSLRTGESLSPMSTSAPVSSLSSSQIQNDMDVDSSTNSSSGWCNTPRYGNRNPFTSVFSRGTTISAMQVTEEMEGLSLWAAAGHDLYEYKLGQTS